MSDLQFRRRTYVQTSKIAQELVTAATQLETTSKWLEGLLHLERTDAELDELAEELRGVLGATRKLAHKAMALEERFGEILLKEEDPYSVKEQKVCEVLQFWIVGPGNVCVATCHDKSLAQRTCAELNARARSSR